MAQELSNGNVFITGSSGGIGSAAVKKLAEGGYRVFAGVRNPEKLKRLSEKLAPDVVPVKIDISDPASVKALLVMWTKR